jgi:DNA polymerase-3 subunit delta
MNKLAPVFLLLGPELGEKESFIKSLLESLRSQYKEEPELHKLYSFENTIHEALAILRNGSLFTNIRVVFFEGAETLKRKEELEALREYIQHPSPEGILLLISDRPSIEKKIQDTVPAEQKKIFWELFDNQKRDWVFSYFKKENIQILPESVELLLELVENNTREMKQVCDNLAWFYKEKGEIHPQDIEEFLYHGKQETVFSLFERILERRLEPALEILHKLLLEGETQPVGILGGLTYQFRTLKNYLRLRKENFSPQEACGKVRILGKRTQRLYMAGEKNFSQEQAEDILVLCADFDEYLRSFRQDLHLLLLELFLYGVIILRGESPFKSFDLSL